jgi:hypothetical protein
LYYGKNVVNVVETSKSFILQSQLQLSTAIKPWYYEVWTLEYVRDHVKKKVTYKLNSDQIA